MIGKEHDDAAPIRRGSSASRLDWVAFGIVMVVPMVVFGVASNELARTQELRWFWLRGIVPSVSGIIYGVVMILSSKKVYFWLQRLSIAVGDKGAVSWPNKLGVAGVFVFGLLSFVFGIVNMYIVIGEVINLLHCLYSSCPHLPSGITP